LRVDYKYSIFKLSCNRYDGMYQGLNIYGLVVHEVSIIISFNINIYCDIS